MTTPLVDVLKLEVGTPPAGLRNLVPNPDGEFGASGWIFPDTYGGTLTGDADDGLTFTTTSSGFQRAQTDWMDLTTVLATADYLGASWRILDPLPAGLYYRARLVYNTAPPESPGPWTGYLNAAGTVNLTPELIPGSNPTTNLVALQFEFYGDTSGGAPAAGKVARFDHVSVAAGATAGDVTAIGYVPLYDWTDILGPTHQIDIGRAPLDANTLSATVIDTALDPAVADTLRFGRPVRVRTLDATTAAWKRLFTGRIETATTDYDLTKPADKQATIALTAYDADAVFSRTKQPSSTTELSSIWDMLYDAGLTVQPYLVDGQTSRTGIYEDSAETNPDATVLDQLAALRNSNLGYLWVDANGVLRAYTDRNADYYGTGTAVLDESAYSKIQVGFDPAQTVNVLTIEERWSNTDGEPTITVWGPYRDEESILEWGEHPATYTIIGPVAGAPPDRVLLIAALADEIFAANADPSVQIASVVLPIRSPADITTEKALLDLYASAQVTNTDRALDQTLRVLSIKHTITATTGRWSWLMSLGFAATGRTSSSGPGGSPAAAVVGIGGVGRPPAFENTDTTTHDGTGDVVLTLTHAPIVKSLQVKQNGLELEPSEWALAGRILTIPAEDWYLDGDVFTAYYAYDQAATPSAPAAEIDYRGASDSVDSWTIPAGAGGGDDGDAAVTGDLLIAVGMVTEDNSVTPNGWTPVGESDPVTHSTAHADFTYRLVLLKKVYDGTSTVPTITGPSSDDAVCLMVAFDGGTTVAGTFDTLADGQTAFTPASDPSSLRVWGTLANMQTITPAGGTVIAGVGGDDIDIKMTLDSSIGTAAASVATTAGWCLASLVVR